MIFIPTTSDFIVKTAVVIGGAGATGTFFYYRNDIYKYFENSLESFLVTVEKTPEIKTVSATPTQTTSPSTTPSTAASENTSEIAQELYEHTYTPWTSEKEIKKNFFCKMHEDAGFKNLDANCQLQKLSQRTQKFLDLSDIKREKRVVDDKAMVKENVYFRLLLDTRKINDLEVGKTKIDLVANKDIASGNKIFFTLKVVAKLNKNNIEAQTNVFVFKMPSDKSEETALDNLQCEIGTVKKVCEIYTLPEKASDLKQINFSSVNKTDKFNKLKKDKYYLAKFTNANDSINQKENISIKITQTSNPTTTIAEVKTEAIFLGKFDGTKTTENSLYILKNIF